MTRARRVLSVLMLLFVAGLAAGQVEEADYFFAVDLAKGGDRWASGVYVTNMNEEDVDLVHFFTALNKKASSSAQTTTSIPAGETILLRPAAPADKIGMMGLLSEFQLHYQPVIGVVTGAPATTESHADLGVDFDELSLLNATMAYSGGAKVLVQVPYGLNELLVFNLSDKHNDCTATVYDETNVESGMKSLGMKANSVKRFKGVKPILAGLPNGHGRVEIECSEQFYPQGFSWSPTIKNVAVMSPKPALLPPPSSGCELSGSYCKIFAGLQHEPKKSPSTWVKLLRFDPPPGVYTKMIYHMDVINKGWAPNAPGLHNLWWSGLNGKNVHQPGYLNVFGPNKSQFLWRHGFSQQAADKAKIKADWVMETNVLYHIRYSYDMKEDLIEVLVTRGSNVELQLLHRPNINSMVIGAGDFYLFGYGFDGGNPAEPPSYGKNGQGWQYLNISGEWGISGNEL